MLRGRPRRLRGWSVNRMVPNGLTVLALCAGLTAIRFALEERWDMAVLAIVIAAVFVYVASQVEWYAVPIVLIGAPATLSLVGILIAQQDGTLSEKGYLVALREFYGTLKLLKGKDNSQS